MADLKKNLSIILDATARAAAVSGRASDSIKIVAATKTRPPEILEELAELGIKSFGENRAQELLAKYDSLRGVEWHFIGALQTNKVKSLIGKTALIQSVDRKSLADEIDRQAEKNGIVQDVLIEVNIGREEQKSGVAEDELDELISYAGACKSLRTKGLMSVMPIGAKSALYERMNKLFSRYFDFCRDYLSMGMSGDYETAIKCGANMIRPGSVLFGPR